MVAELLNSMRSLPPTVLAFVPVAVAMLCLIYKYAKK